MSEPAVSPAAVDSVSQELAREFASVARDLQTPDSHRSTLQVVCELAVKVLHADDAAITVRRDNGYVTLASTSERAERVDRIQ